MNIETYSYMSAIGPIEMQFNSTRFTIKTERLVLLSLNQDQTNLVKNYVTLLNDVNNVKLFTCGKAWTKRNIVQFLKEEIQKWQAGNPFSAFSVYNLHCNTFMGSLNLTHVENEYENIGRGHLNVAEISYVLDSAFWGKGYGTELAMISEQYITHLLSIRKDDTTFPLVNEIVATVHPENVGSKKVLQKVLKHQEREIFFKYGGKPRLLFFKVLN